MTAVYIEAGTAATRDFKQFLATSVSGTGAITSDAQAVSGSVRSIKCDAGATGAGAEAWAWSPVWTGSNELYHSFHIRPGAALPQDGCEIVRYTSAGAPVFELFSDGAGNLKVVDSAFALQIGSSTSGAVLATSTDTQVTVACSITSTITFRIRIWFGSTLVYDQQHGGTIGSRTIDGFTLGIIGGAQNNAVLYFAHQFVDNTYRYGEYRGDIRCTVKRPDANGDTNGFTTQIGAGGSGYGSGHSPQVNERPLSATNGWSLNTSSAVTEEYGVEAAATGDVDISGKQVIDILGWLWAKTTTSTRTCQIILNGVSTAISVTTTAAWYEKYAAAASYPGGAGNDIGMTSQAASDTYSLYECGIQVAYYHDTATLGVTGTATASIVEGDIVSGGKTGIATLTNDAWLPASFVSNIELVGRQHGGWAGDLVAHDITFALSDGLASVPAAGDLVVAMYHIGSTVARQPTISDTGGTTYPVAFGGLLQRADNFDSSLIVLGKFMGGTPDTQIRFTEAVGGGTGSANDAGRYAIFVFRGVDSTTPNDVAAVTAGATNSSTVNPGSITPTTAGACIVIAGGAASGTGSTMTATYLTNFLAGSTADTNDSSAGMGYRYWATGAYDGANFGNVPAGTTANSWNCVTIALRPATATPYADSRAAQAAGYDSAQAEATGFDALKATILPVSAFARTSSTVSTATFAAAGTFNITAQETVTVSVGSGVTVRGLPITGTPTFTIDPAGGSMTDAEKATAAHQLTTIPVRTRTRVVAY